MGAAAGTAVICVALREVPVKSSLLDVLTAVNRSGRGFIVTDNDGVVDSSGETQFLRLGDID